MIEHQIIIVMALFAFAPFVGSSLVCVSSMKANNEVSLFVVITNVHGHYLSVITRRKGRDSKGKLDSPLSIGLIELDYYVACLLNNSTRDKKVAMKVFQRY
jgi:hypothetical protein